MSIAQSILDIVDEYMTKENGRKLMEVAVEVGELVAVVPDSLTFCYEALVENSPYRDSKLSINIIPLTGTCPDCGKSFKINNTDVLTNDTLGVGVTQSNLQTLGTTIVQSLNISTGNNAHMKTYVLPAKPVQWFNIDLPFYAGTDF